MKEIALPFNMTYFNNLSSVEDADKALIENDKLVTALKVLGPIFLKHNMYKSWGISLLHKHFEINNDEKPIQDVIMRGDRKSYITTPRNSSYGKMFFPAIFKIEGSDQLIPLEYSTDSSAQLANKELQANPEFIKEFHQALIDFDLKNNFGLVFGKTVDYEFELVEFNYTNRVSVLEERTSDEVKGLSTIQTAWFFSLDSNNLACVTKCLRRCVKDGSGSHNDDHAVYHDPNG
jgi:hypothetical protein